MGAFLTARVPRDLRTHFDSRVMTVKQGFWSRLRRDHGASAVEYALLIAGIAIVMIVAVFFVGSVVVSDLQETGSSLGTITSTQTPSHLLCVGQVH